MGKKNRKLRQAAGQTRRARVEFVDRPFAGIAAEPDLVAMREVIPAAMARVKTTAAYGARELWLVTLLPDGIPAVRREDGELMVALQTAMHSGDASRDIAYAIEAALELDKGQALTLDELPEPGPRLQEVIDWSQAWQVDVHDTFDYWLNPAEIGTERGQQVLEQLRAETVPTEAVPGVAGAYWCRMNGKEFVRWARPEEENALLDGLARLQAQRTLQVAPETKFLGAFRSCGILVPVWELPAGLSAADLAAPMQAFAPQLAEAAAKTEALSPEERRAKAGIVSRQVTLR